MVEQVLENEAGWKVVEGVVLGTKKRSKVVWRDFETEIEAQIDVIEVNLGSWWGVRGSEWCRSGNEVDAFWSFWSNNRRALNI